MEIVTMYKNIIFDLNKVLFVQNELAYLNGTSNRIWTVLDEGIAILQLCHQQRDENGTRRFKLFALSNCKSRTWEKLKEEFPELVKLFDGAILSEEVKLKKPDIGIYQHLLDTYQLKPHESIFIDDKHENLLPAEELGIFSILCDDHTKVCNKLKELNIL